MYKCEDCGLTSILPLNAHCPDHPCEDEEAGSSFITVMKLAEYRGVKEDSSGSVSAGAFLDVGLPFMGGCGRCGATCAVYNMCPTKTGNISCLDCVHEGIGFETVEEANKFCFPDEHVWLGVNRVADKTEPDQE